MRPSSIERPEDDVTLQLLDDVIDGSIAGTGRLPPAEDADGGDPRPARAPRTRPQAGPQAWTSIALR